MLAVETGLSPTDLLASPPRVLDEIIEYVLERAEKQRRERLQAELKGAIA